MIDELRREIEDLQFNLSPNRSGPEFVGLPYDSFVEIDMNSNSYLANFGKTAGFDRVLINLTMNRNEPSLLGRFVGINRAIHLSPDAVFAPRLENWGTLLHEQQHATVGNQLRQGVKVLLSGRLRRADNHTFGIKGSYNRSFALDEITAYRWSLAHLELDLQARRKGSPPRSEPLQTLKPTGFSPINFQEFYTRTAEKLRDFTDVTLDALKNVQLQVRVSGERRSISS